MLKKLHIVFALLCAVAMSQFPEFHQQYTQRIGGALDELTLQVAALDERARNAGMDRYDYVRHFQNNSDSIVKGEGDAMLATLSRQQRLAKAYDRLTEAPWYMIVVETAFHLEPDVAANTAEVFVPAVPISFSGAVHTFAGFLIGYLLPAMLGSLVPRRRSRAA
ncbi:DUF2937 family protein [Pacificispira sp.]|uniref:DUF2937 family protein n=1 Tax=Pacificispira sp. TaxID=2888761 RepID=UPI003BA85378